MATNEGIQEMDGRFPAKCQGMDGRTIKQMPPCPAQCAALSGAKEGIREAATAVSSHQLVAAGQSVS